MTLIPSEAWNVAGVEGDKYTVGPFCDAPGCKRPVDHKHHLWRRSFLGGDYWWVRVPTSRGTTVTIRNVVGLCYHHHEDVTGDVGGHKAWIRWNEQREDFDWLESVDYGHWQKIGTLTLPTSPEPTAPIQESERCPTCGHVKRHDHEHREPGPRRAKKSWTMKVPADSENGWEEIEEYVEIIGEAIGAGEYTSALRRFYVVQPSLFWVMQNLDAFVHDFYDEKETA
jgi:hypothetical protein